MLVEEGRPSANEASPGVPCVFMTPAPGVLSTRALVGGAGEPGRPAPVVSDRVFKPFGAHSTVDR